MSGDPAVEAARMAVATGLIDGLANEGMAHRAARYALNPIWKKLGDVRERYVELESRMLLVDSTPAETSRYANEMAGLKFAFDAIAPLVYAGEEAL